MATNTRNASRTSGWGGVVLIPFARVHNAADAAPYAGEMRCGRVGAKERKIVKTIMLIRCRVGGRLVGVQWI